MAKLDWIDVVDRALVRADRFADRFRKTPRRRLDVVPSPLMPVDPFGAPPIPKPGAEVAPPAAPIPTPLGDPGLPAQIYGKRTCDATARTVQLFRGASITARMIDLDDPEHRDLENRLVRETKRYDLPYVFVRGELIGGFAETAALAKSGELTRRAAQS